MQLDSISLIKKASSVASKPKLRYLDNVLSDFLRLDKASSEP